MLLSALFLAGGALALSHQDCFSAHSAALAELSSCGNQASLQKCFSGVAAANDIASLKPCFVDAGCSDEAALLNARKTFDHCDEWASAMDLKKRFRAYPIPALPAKTISPVVDASGTSPNVRATGSVNMNFLFGRAEKITDCMDTHTFTTKSCDETTSGPHVITGSCSSVPATSTSCKDGLTCSMDKAGQTVCMELQNSLDTAGIIISIVFGAALVLGIVSLTYLCCQDRRQQKRLAAKAEATALARAATKKQRAAEVRTPLMRQQDATGAPTVSSPLAAGPPGGHDPFGDQHHN